MKYSYFAGLIIWSTMYSVIYAAPLQKLNPCSSDASLPSCKVGKVVKGIEENYEERCYGQTTWLEAYAQLDTKKKKIGDLKFMAHSLKKYLEQYNLPQTSLIMVKFPTGESDTQRTTMALFLSDGNKDFPHPIDNLVKVVTHQPRCFYVFKHKGGSFNQQVKGLRSVLNQERETFSYDGFYLATYMMKGVHKEVMLSKQTKKMRKINMDIKNKKASKKD